MVNQSFAFNLSLQGQVLNYLCEYSTHAKNRYGIEPAITRLPRNLESLKKSIFVC